MSEASLELVLNCMSFVLRQLVKLALKEYRDRLAGGLADAMKPSRFDAKSLAKGMKIELEHTKDEEIALEIAMDHLAEDPLYYRKLEKIENK